MPPLLIAYLSSALLFTVIDLIWLTLVMSKIFRAELGSLLLDQPRPLPALAFYALYPLGIAVFAVLPASSAPLRALGLGALLGLIAYGTYELTNLATLSPWQTKLAVIDMAWGAALTGVVAALSVLIMQRWLAGS